MWCVTTDDYRVYMSVHLLRSSKHILEPPFDGLDTLVERWTIFLQFPLRGFPELITFTCLMTASGVTGPFGAMLHNVHVNGPDGSPHVQCEGQTWMS